MRRPWTTAFHAAWPTASPPFDGRPNGGACGLREEARAPWARPAPRPCPGAHRGAASSRRRRACPGRTPRRSPATADPRRRYADSPPARFRKSSSSPLARTVTMPSAILVSEQPIGSFATTSTSAPVSAAAVRGRAACPAGADHDHVAVAPHGLDRHARSPSVGGADHAANACRTQRCARSPPRPPRAAPRRSARLPTGRTGDGGKKRGMPADRPRPSNFGPSGSGRWSATRRRSGRLRFRRRWAVSGAASPACPQERFLPHRQAVRGGPMCDRCR